MVVGGVIIATYMDYAYVVAVSPDGKYVWSSRTPSPVVDVTTKTSSVVRGCAINAT